MRHKITSIVLIINSLIFMNTTAQETKIKLTINSQTELTATLVDNSSVTALIGLLKDGPLTIAMSDYGNMEKVGSIGTSLPRNDEQITTEPGDIILYQGNALVIYYAPNLWNFTRLGKIDDVTQNELKNILGTGSVTVNLELLNATNITESKQFENIEVYPNPVGNYLNVQGQYENLTLLDINGCIICSSKYKTMDVSNIIPGVYFLKVDSGNKRTMMKKIIKT